MRILFFNFVFWLSLSAFADNGNQQVNNIIDQRGYDSTANQMDNLNQGMENTNNNISNITNSDQGVVDAKTASELSQAQTEAGSQSNLAGGAAMIATGVAISASCSCGAGAPLIVFGGGMVAQGNSFGGTAADTNFNRGFIVNTNSLGPVTTTSLGEHMWDNPFAPYGIGNPKTPTPNQLIKDLKKQGYDLNLEKNTITLPDGTVHNLKNMNSKEAMKNAGFDAGGIADAFAMAEEMNKKAEKAIPKVIAAKLKSAPGGAGGGGAGGGSGNGEGNGAHDPFANLFKKKKKRGPASVAGMAKLRNGDLIGVAGDNIFKMLNRRYYAKCKQRTLIGCD